jgi:intracellular sulfur oxidation DsrE/DsrF family protein
MWAKYRLGEELALNGADGRPATLNPWRSAPQILGMTLPQASIESLQQRGATFIICNNALEIFAALLAQKRGLDPKVVYEDMKANILPGVTLVPAMVIAVEKAQAAGFTYQRQ